MEALRGASELLLSIIAVQAEILLVHAHVNECDWLEVIQWMRQKGFEVPTAIADSRIEPQAREFDFVFARN